MYLPIHTMMALTPAYRMSKELPADQQALPIMKVLYRNCNRMQEKGGHAHEVLHEVTDKATGVTPDLYLTNMTDDSLRRNVYTGFETGTSARLAAAILR